MNANVKQLPSINLFGIPINAVTMEQVIEVIDQTIKTKSSLHIGVVNAAKVVNMSRNPELGEDVLSSDLVLADGAAVVWASRILREPLPCRVTGIDLMFKMLELCNHHKYRVFCFGATEDVSKTVCKKIARDYPNAIVAGRRNGYYDDADEAQIAQQIAESKADILLVAITSPRKENFMARWNETMKVPVVHGVGGSFDVMAGKVKRAPESWQKLGMEWLYRLLQEPNRLWKRYLVTNSIFCWILLKALVGKLTKS